MLQKGNCSHVTNSDRRNFKILFSSEIGNESDICNAEIVK